MTRKLCVIFYNSKLQCSEDGNRSIVQHVVLFLEYETMGKFCAPPVWDCSLQFTLCLD